MNEINELGQECISSPFSGQLGEEGIPAVRKHVENFQDETVYWRKSELLLGLASCIPTNLAIL